MQEFLQFQPYDLCHRVEFGQLHHDTIGKAAARYVLYGALATCTADMYPDPSVGVRTPALRKL